MCFAFEHAKPKVLHLLLLLALVLTLDFHINGSPSYRMCCVHRTERTQLEEILRQKNHQENWIGQTQNIPRRLVPYGPVDEEHECYDE